MDLSCVVVADHLSRGGHRKLEWKRLPSHLPCGSEAAFSPGAAELLRRARASTTRGSQEKRRGAGKHIMGTEGCSSCCLPSVHTCHSRIAPWAHRHLRILNPHLHCCQLLVCLLECSEDRPQSICGQGRKHKLELWPYLLENERFLAASLVN